MNWTEAAIQDLQAWPEVDMTRLGQGAVELKEAWNSSSKDPDTFYLRDDVGRSYIYDLTAWHSSKAVDTWIGCIRRWGAQLPKGSRVLDLGAGIGTYSLLMAELGLKVSACEVNPVLRRYIEYRATRHNLSLELCSIPTSQFDMIVCLDTIEHFSHPDTFPAWAHMRLVPGGLLIATWTFHQSNGMHPMHCTPDREPSFIRALEAAFAHVEGGWPMAMRARM